MAVLDFIYVNYNSSKWLIHSIEALLKWNPGEHDLNIVVVDNSSEANLQRAKSLFPNVTLILNKRNVGFGAAVNQALARCHSKYIVLLNPDSVVTDGFIEESIRLMEQNGHIAILGPMILDDDGSVQGSARTFPNPLTSIFGRNSPLSKMFPNNSITRANIITWRADDKTPMEVDWVSGACMVIRREAMDTVGGFDERFFLYWEDTDLCRRVKKAGWNVVYFPGARVVHSVGKSSDTRPAFAIFQFHKSCFRLYEKYASWPFSFLTPVAAIALMLRFSAAVFYNYLRRLVESHKNRKT